MKCIFRRGRLHPPHVIIWPRWRCSRAKGEPPADIYDINLARCLRQRYFRIEVVRGFLKVSGITDPDILNVDVTLRVTDHAQTKPNIDYSCQYVVIVRVDALKCKVAHHSKPNHIDFG